MAHTTVRLPDELELRAKRRAEELGITFGELLRESLEQRLAAEPRPSKAPAEDPLYAAGSLVYSGSSPADLAAEHDRYLYGDDVPRT